MCEIIEAIVPCSAPPEFEADDSFGKQSVTVLPTRVCIPFHFFEPGQNVTLRNIHI